MSEYTDANEQDLYMELSAAHRVLNNRNEETAGGKTLAIITPDSLTLRPVSGASSIYPLRGVPELWGNDYHIYLSLPNGDTLDLHQLGYKYEDALNRLVKNHRRLTLLDMLVKEKILFQNATADHTRFSPAGDPLSQGNCELLLYETSLMIMPERSSVIRLPLGRVDEIHQEEYSLTLAMDSGERYTLSRLGYQTDPFSNALRGTIDRLFRNTADFLRQWLMESDPQRLNRLTRLMKDGKFALRRDIEALDPRIWQAIDLQISRSPLGDEYEFLKSRGETEQIAVGVKRGLPGAARQDYFWFLIPLTVRAQNGATIPAAAFEAGLITLPASSEDNRNQPQPDSPSEYSGEDAVNEENASPETAGLKQEGKATYFFRLSDENDAPADPHAEPPLYHFIRSLNRGLMEINFRREPIYLSEQKLDDPRYIKYKHAINRLPELQRLRRLFLGRTLHKSEQQWREDVQNLLDGGAASDHADQNGKKPSL